MPFSITQYTSHLGATLFSRRNMIGLGAIFFVSVFFVSSVAATNADFSDTANGTIRITVMIPDDPPAVTKVPPHPVPTQSPVPQSTQPTVQDDPTPTPSPCPSPCPAPSEPPAPQPVSNPSQTPVPTQPEGQASERQASEGQTVSP